jgi:hypothetical protein
MVEWLMSGGWIVLCCFFGPAMLFSEPISERKRRRENPKPSPKQKRTARKNRAVVKKDLTTQKRKKEKPKGWFVPPPLSPWQEDLLTRYRVGRDFTFQN